MRNWILAAATAATIALSVGTAEAFPVLPASGIDAAPAMTLVSGGCGPYRHRGPFGGCRPNFRGYYGRPYGFYRPYGFHRPGYFYGHRRFHHYRRFY